MEMAIVVVDVRARIAVVVVDDGDRDLGLY